MLYSTIKNKLSNLKIVSIIVLILTVSGIEGIFLMTSYHFKKDQLSDEIKTLKEKMNKQTIQNIKLLETIQKFVNLIATLRHETDIFSDTTKTLYQIIINETGVEKQKKINKYSNRHTLKEIEELRNIIVNMKGMKVKTDYIKNKLEQYKNILATIPSQLPIVPSGKIVSQFGRWKYKLTSDTYDNKGVVIAYHPKSKVVATANGLVHIAGADRVKGELIEIVHKYGFSTEYYPITQIYVYPGQKVKKGQIIGEVGYRHQNRLTYEIQLNGESVDPMPFIKLDIYNYTIHKKK